MNHIAWIFILLALLMNGCAATPQKFQPATGLPDDGPPSLPSTARQLQPATGLPDGSSQSSLEQQFRSEVHKWAGTPHRLGGTDHSGIDCSGFVQRIYRDLFGLQLPRTTADQVQYAEKIQDRPMQTGDLVFFRPSKNVRHVGIYLGEGEFAHASKTSGVMVSRMDDPYWRNVYWTVRRVLPEPP